MKKMFRSKYPLDVRQNFSEPGSKLRYSEGWTIEDGSYVWTSKGVKDIDQEINSHRESCDLKLILERFKQLDESQLNAMNAMYVDTIDLPKNYKDMYTASHKMKEIFEAMPLEIRSHYNHDLGAFTTAYGSTEMLEFVNAYRCNEYAKFNKEDPSPISVDTFHSVDTVKPVDIVKPNDSVNNSVKEVATDAKSE